MEWSVSPGRVARDAPAIPPPPPLQRPGSDGITHAASRSSARAAAPGRRTITSTKLRRMPDMPDAGGLPPPPPLVPRRTRAKIIEESAPAPDPKEEEIVPRQRRRVARAAPMAPEAPVAPAPEVEEIVMAATPRKKGSEPGSGRFGARRPFLVTPPAVAMPPPVGLEDLEASPTGGDEGMPPPDFVVVWGVGDWILLQAHGDTATATHSHRRILMVCLLHAFAAVHRNQCFTWLHFSSHESGSLEGLGNGPKRQGGAGRKAHSRSMSRVCASTQSQQQDGLVGLQYRLCIVTISTCPHPKGAGGVPFCNPPAPQLCTTDVSHSQTPGPVLHFPLQRWLAPSSLHRLVKD